MQEELKKVILKTLSEIACGNTGTCQINLQSESAREMVANKLLDKLTPFVQNKAMELIEDVVCSNGEYNGK